MLRRRLDVPLDRDGSVRFVPWVIALMVYLAAVVLAIGLVVSGAVGRWDRSLAGTLTVELPPLKAGAADGMDKVLALLRATPGIQKVEPLATEDTSALLKPWLGAEFSATDLALPRLIDVHIDLDAPPDTKALAQQLAAAVPGASLDDHRLWLDGLIRMARTIELVAAAIILLIGGAAVLTIIFATRTGLAIHHGVIQVLHLIGARDSYIAAQFQWQALMLALRGGLVGIALAALTLFAIGHAAQTTRFQGAEGGLLPSIELSVLGWIAVVLLPFAAGLIALLTARLTVLRALARMP